MRSDFIFQKKTEAAAKKFGITPEEMAIADLVAAGWEKKEAFMLVYRVGATWTPYALTNAVKEIFEKKGTKERLRTIKKGENTMVVLTEAEVEGKTKTSITKESMLADLVTARNSMATGSKDWIEISKMIADITRMKQDEIKNEDSTIMYYLPQRCFNCECYAKYKKDNK